MHTVSTCHISAFPGLVNLLDHVLSTMTKLYQMKIPVLSNVPWLLFFCQLVVISCSIAGCFSVGLLVFRGIEAGICGAPSFQVNGGPVIFGQDRLGLVADLLCGWVPPDVLSAEAKL